MQFENKLVAVMAIDSGIIMNSLANMCIGFGSKIGVEDLFFDRL